MNLNRRGFLKVFGIGAATAVTAPMTLAEILKQLPEKIKESVSKGGISPYTLSVELLNGKYRSVGKLTSLSMEMQHSVIDVTSLDSYAYKYDIGNLQSEVTVELHTSTEELFKLKEIFTNGNPYNYKISVEKEAVLFTAYITEINCSDITTIKLQTSGEVIRKSI